MACLSEQGRIKLANEYTSLAIQNGLVSKGPNAETTALNICNLFKTIYENLQVESSVQE